MPSTRTGANDGTTHHEGKVYMVKWEDTMQTDDDEPAEKFKAQVLLQLEEDLRISFKETYSVSE